MSTPHIGTRYVGIRQNNAGTFAGDPPEVGGVEMQPDKFEGGLYTYVDPNDHSKDTSVTGKGGEFNFGSLAVVVHEIRASIGANNYTATVEDASGSVSCEFLSAVSGDNTRQAFEIPVTVLPGERLRITSAGGSGAITVYCSIGDKR